MVLFAHSFVQNIILALACVSYVAATPSTRRIRSVGSQGLNVETFFPESTYETYGAGVTFLSKRQNSSLNSTTVDIVVEKTGISASEISYKSGYTTSTNQVGYVRQKHDGIEFANTAANVAIKGNKVVAFGSSLVKPTKVASKTPTIAVKAAVATAEKALHGTFDDKVAPKLEYFVKPDNSAVLAHVLRISNKKDFTFYEAFINAHSGVLEGVIDFVNDATYRVVPLVKQSVEEGLEDLTDPQDKSASPEGWHIPLPDGSLQTAGNNVVAGKDGNITSQSGSNEFLYTYDTTQEPNIAVNVNAASVNTFFVVNSVHDILYRYGFTEAAFNFQRDNFGKGGLGGDSVQVSVQDKLATDNANFATFPEGQPGLMRMFIWTYTSPQRDGDLENDIIVHEATHGLTNRMVGGGTARCLQSTEGGGLGEGWSDAFAEWIQHKSATIEDFAVGKWVTNNPAGIRRYPYSTDPAVNPLMYSDVKKDPEVHSIGEVWANMLHNVYAALVDKHGFSANAATNPDGTEGNVVFLHLFIDSLPMLACNPTFLTTRNAWIQADADRYGGVNKCLLWKVFASRGLGVNAAHYIDDTTIPSDC